MWKNAFMTSLSPSRRKLLRALSPPFRTRQLYCSRPRCNKPPPHNIPKTEGPLYQRLKVAWTSTPTKWYPLPVAVGALLLVAIQYRKKLDSKEAVVDQEGELVRLKGPWQIHVFGALPWRNLSRLWGYLNGLELPMWFRPYGFKLYAFIFGCNLDEIEPKDLTKYASLGEFFYRRLQDGARPIASTSVVSPADGTVLHFGTVGDKYIEQVKGMTYSLDALLGVLNPSKPPAVQEVTLKHGDDVHDREFANVNGIEYSLDQLLGHQKSTTDPEKPSPVREGERIDASVEREEGLAHDTAMALEVGIRPALSRSDSSSSTSSTSSQLKRTTDASLHFAVVYLAPGDYHRFHSPAAWVVEKRRHFTGELYSVSPYVAKRAANLFVLNERVALLGRWRHGFFSMVPVGATNVGSITVNFDSALRTNVRGPRPQPGAFTEAHYKGASAVLGGQPLSAGQEMGGFRLGSTIVLVFEAPKEFQFAIKPGQRLKVGEPIGDIVPTSQ